jgi:hypothetical protein
MAERIALNQIDFLGNEWEKYTYFSIIHFSSVLLGSELIENGNVLLLELILREIRWVFELFLLEVFVLSCESL